MDNLKDKDIIKMPIDMIFVNPENPRHDTVINIEESFVMQQLVSNKKDTSAMYKLICDIGEEGWYPQSIVTITYDKIKEKYFAWDGNRRLTALKILQKPKLADKLGCFTYVQIQHINELSNKIKDKTFFEVSCYIAANLEECAGYIRNIHTSDTSVLQWNGPAIKRFENRLGKRNLFSQMSEYMSKPFENISNKFSVGKFEKLVSSKIGKDFLGISNQDGIFTINSPEKEKELEEKLSIIVKDVDNNIVKSKTIQNKSNIEEYFKGIDNNYSNTESKRNSEIVTKKNAQQIEMHGLKVPSYNVQQSLIRQSKINYIKKEKRSIFFNINIKNLNFNNPRSIGIRDLCYEIQQMCRFNQDNKYKISFCFIIRSLLEQSAIYFLINMQIWETLRSRYNNKDLRLEQIILETEKRKETFFDDTILRCWNTVTETTATKDYFDLIVHHPYLIRANLNVVNTISESGLFALIQFFINS